VPRRPFITSGAKAPISNQGLDAAFGSFSTDPESTVIRVGDAGGDPTERDDS